VSPVAHLTAFLQEREPTLDSAERVAHPRPSASLAFYSRRRRRGPKTAPLALCPRLRPCSPQVPATGRRDSTKPLPFLAHHEPLRPNARLLPFSTPSAAAVPLPTLFALISHLFRTSPPAVRGAPNVRLCVSLHPATPHSSPGLLHSSTCHAHLPIATAHLSPSRAQDAK
jgi:hypothetical protein